MTISPVTADAGRPSGCPAAVGEHAARAEPVCIELSTTQVDQVVRAASDAGSLSILLSGLGDVRAAFAAGREQLDERRLSRSLLSGLFLLASFPADGTYLRVTQIARTLGMSQGTTHRYLTTLVTAGLLEQHPSTREYRLANAG
jgi:Fic family protein